MKKIYDKNKNLKEKRKIYDKNIKLIKMINGKMRK
jgi:hypothetical protein